MTVLKLAGRLVPGRYAGLSSDTKPTEATNPGAVGRGATFFETDTGILYFTADGTTWVVKDSTSVGRTGIGHGVETVDAAGTHQAIVTSSTLAKVVIIQAQTDNTGAIAVGASGVDATVATGTGVLLLAGDSVTLEVDDLADVFIDATVTDDGVRFTYLT